MWINNTKCPYCRDDEGTGKFRCKYYIDKPEMYDYPYNIPCESTTCPLLNPELAHMGLKDRKNFNQWQIL